ncbi:MAG: hypothetical protein JRC92_12280 [Deltaproteobacteria bacterium]|nr:hypothetical protein [Deltaproteobacteria bacterium]
MTPTTQEVDQRPHHGPAGNRNEQSPQPAHLSQGFDEVARRVVGQGGEEVDQPPEPDCPEAAQDPHNHAQGEKIDLLARPEKSFKTAVDTHLGLGRVRRTI